LTAFCAVVAAAVALSSRVFAAASSPLLVTRLLSTPAFWVFSPARVFWASASWVCSGVIWLTSVDLSEVSSASSVFAAAIAAVIVALSASSLVSDIVTVSNWPTSVAYSASRAAISFSAAVICAVRVVWVVTRAARSPCSVAIC
jgi:hypothetical protein